MDKGWYSKEYIEKSLLDKIKEKDKKIKNLEQQNLRLEHRLAVQTKVNQKLLKLVNEQMPDPDLLDRNKVIDT